MTIRKQAFAGPLALAVLAFSGGVAHAEPIKQIGEIGKGTFVNNEVGAVAVNQNTSDIYVADIEGQRILEYTPTGGGVASYGADQAFTTPTVPSTAISAPPVAPLIATQPVAFPGEVKTTTTKTAKKKKPAKKKKKKKIRAKKKTKSKQKGGNKR